MIPDKFSCDWLEDEWFLKVEAHLKLADHGHYSDHLHPNFCMECRVLAMSFEAHSQVCAACAAIPIRPETARSLIKQLGGLIEVLKKSSNPDASKFIAEAENLRERVLSLMETFSDVSN